MYFMIAADTPKYNQYQAIFPISESQPPEYKHDIGRLLHAGLDLQKLPLLGSIVFFSQNPVVMLPVSNFTSCLKRQLHTRQEVTWE